MTAATWKGGAALLRHDWSEQMKKSPRLKAFLMEVHKAAEEEIQNAIEAKTNSVVHAKNESDYLDRFFRTGDALMHAILRTLFKPDTPLRLFKSFSIFLPRAAREDLDIVIADLEEDVADMEQQKRSRRYIFTKLLGRVVRTITAYIVDGARSALLKWLPFLTRR